MLSKVEQKKLRLKKALSHESPDRIPVSDFFWTGFIKNARKSFGEDFDPYRYFDMDYVVVTPNMDPHIKPFEILREEGEDIVLKTGFGAVIKRSGTAPMPHYDSFSVKSPEEMAQFTFEDPKDHRRFYQGGDDQINCVGDALHRNLPDWDQRVDFYKDELAVFGSVCEPYEYLWRIIGMENAMYWMMEETKLFKDFVDRIGQFVLNFTEAQIEAGKGRLSGMYIWGDIAYKNGMLFNPATWRAVFKPHVKALIDLCHKNGLMVIYHGCGNATPVFEDMIKIGLDAYNPLEVKAGLDAVKLKKVYGSRLAYAGNIDVRILESGNAEAIKREVLYKMRAGINGGWIFQSDHSVSSDVTPENYKLAVDILRQYGNYPLKTI